MGDCMLMKNSFLSRLPDPIGGVPHRRYRRAADQTKEFPARETEIGRSWVQAMGMVCYGMQDAFFFCFCRGSDVVWCEGADAF